MLEPLQMVLEAVLMETEGVTGAPTVKVMLLDVAVVGAAHAALLVSTQVITSLLLKLAAAYVELLVPTLVPFFFH
jgi:hypothetical protein